MVHSHEQIIGIYDWSQEQDDTHLIACAAPEQPPALVFDAMPRLAKRAERDYVKGILTGSVGRDPLFNA